MKSRLDLSFTTANFPDDYLPYTSSYSRNKEPYLVWDNGFNGDSSDGQHYHHSAAASIDSHSPASLNQCHLQSHNHHLYPICSTSSSSWPLSSKRKKCCGFSCGCCAVSVIAVLIMSALATVVGFSIYLAMITNLHKSSLVSLSGSFKVDKGDEFDAKLANTSSTEFLAKAAKYETIIKTAMESSAINNAIAKQEVYAFRKGSLIVYFRIYLDRRKVDIIMNGEVKASAVAASAEEKHEFDEVIAVRLVQRELKDGISQLKIRGSERIIIDIKSIQVSNEFDAFLDHDLNDIKTSGVLSTKSSNPRGKDTKLMSNNFSNSRLNKSDTTGRTTQQKQLEKQKPTTHATVVSSTTTPDNSKVVSEISSFQMNASVTTNATQPTALPTQPVVITTSSTLTHSSSSQASVSIATASTANSVEPEVQNVSTVKLTTERVKHHEVSVTTNTLKSTSKTDAYLPFTRRQSTQTPLSSSQSSSTNIRLTTRSKLRSTKATPASTPLPTVTPLSSTSSAHDSPSSAIVSTTTTTTTPSSLKASTTVTTSASNESTSNSSVLKTSEVKESGLKFSNIDFGQWKPVTPQQHKPPPPPPKLLPPLPPPKPLPPPPPPKPIPSQHNPFLSNHPHFIHHQHLPPLLKPPPRIGPLPPHRISNRPILRIPLPVGIGMQEVPRLLDNGGYNFNFSSLTDHSISDDNPILTLLSSSSSQDEPIPTTLLPIAKSSTTTSTTTTTTTTTTTMSPTSTTSTTRAPINMFPNPSMVDGFMVPVFSGAQDPQEESVLSFQAPVINQTNDQFFLRKNKSLSELLPEKQQTFNEEIAVPEANKTSSPYYDDKPQSSSSTVRSTEVFVGSQVLRLSRPLKKKGEEKAIVQKVDTINNNNNNSSTLNDFTANRTATVLTLNQSIDIKPVSPNNGNNKTLKTKSPFDYHFAINSSSSQNTVAVTPSTTTKLVYDHQPNRTQPTVQTIIRRTSTTTALPPDDDRIPAGLPIGIDKYDPLLPEKLIFTSNLNEPEFGERLPKFIPPTLFQKIPTNNELINSGAQINGGNPQFDADEALYDDEIAPINYTFFSSFANENSTWISQRLETTTAVSTANECLDSEFQCGSGECVAARGYCNRRVECTDGSDEMNCTCANYLRAERQFRKICDGIVDCYDASDETNCPYCRDSYVCSGSNMCIDRSKICNGENDCPTGDDESECIALVSDNRTPVSTGRYLNSEGVLYIRQRGEWAPLCLDQIHIPNELDGDHSGEQSWKLEDFGKAVCRASSYHDLHSVSVFSLANYKSGPYFQIEEPNDRISSLTMWNSLFQKSICSTKRTTYVKCSGFECGVRPIETASQRRIVGGQSASLGSWPWQVALYRDGEFQCGGVIIDSQWLLTAAHCFHSTRNAYWTARFGILRRGNPFASPYEQLRRISHIILHEEYVDKGFINDIALLRLNEPINFSKHVGPICLPSPDEHEVSLWHKQLCTTVGWGKLFEHGRIFPDTLQEVKLPVISTEECRKRTLFLPLYKITDNMFCAGYDRGGRDACLGDSGGPMMCQRRNGRWFLLGVTSNGDGCGRAGRPGVYTKVAKYMDWIDKTINGFIPKEIDRRCDSIRCPLGKCLPKQSVCNGVIDCRDASDELNCAHSGYHYSNNNNTSAFYY